MAHRFWVQTMPGLAKSLTRSLTLVSNNNAWCFETTSYISNLLIWGLLGQIWPPWNRWETRGFRCIINGWDWAKTLFPTKFRDLRFIFQVPISLCFQSWPWCFIGYPSTVNLWLSVVSLAIKFQPSNVPGIHDFKHYRLRSQWNIRFSEGRYVQSVLFWSFHIHFYEVRLHLHNEYCTSLKKVYKISNEAFLF